MAGGVPHKFYHNQEYNKYFKMCFHVFWTTKYNSDYAMQFTSDEFKRLCKCDSIKAISEALYHPAINGLAENGVKTVKTALIARMFTVKRLT